MQKTRFKQRGVIQSEKAEVWEYTRNGQTIDRQTERSSWRQSATIIIMSISAPITELQKPAITQRRAMAELRYRVKTATTENKEHAQ